ncbi:hypothetical protein KDL45_18695, partial [bacterium]|nr:hypothetical protein [bacterium]
MTMRGKTWAAPAAMLAAAMLAMVLSAGSWACGGDDDDDDDDDAVDDDTDDDDDDDTDDDDDDDTDDDDDDDTDDDDDDDDDDTAGTTDFGGTVVDFKEGTPLANGDATVELLDDATGDSFDPPLTQTTDADGKVFFEDIPVSKDGTIAAKVTANDYKATVQYHFETGTASEELLAVSET